MELRAIGLAMAATVGLAGCQQPFDYETASDAERQEWLDSVAQGVYDGLSASLPKGRGGVHMTMGPMKTDIDRRRIDITVNSDIDSGNFTFTDQMNSATVLRDSCPGTYLGTALERNDIVIYTRYAYDTGGTFMAVKLSREDCAPYAREE